MSFLGNLNGPKESEIIEKLGPNYFGISWEQLEAELSHNRFAENRNEIVPVNIDNTGEPYILLSSPDKKDNVLFEKSRISVTWQRTLRK